MNLLNALMISTEPFMTMSLHNGKFRRRSTAGFTVMEIVAVLFVIGVISVAVITRSNLSVTFESESDVLKASIRYAQLRSLNTDSVWYIQFVDTPVSYYELFRDGTPVSLPGEQLTSRNLPEGISINPQGSDIVSFDAYGRPCTDANGATPQEGTRNIVISDGSDSETITIIEDTGFIP